MKIQSREMIQADLYLNVQDLSGHLRKCRSLPLGSFTLGLTVTLDTWTVGSHPGLDLASHLGQNVLSNGLPSSHSKSLMCVCFQTPVGPEATSCFCQTAPSEIITEVDGMAPWMTISLLQNSWMSTSMMLSGSGFAYVCFVGPFGALPPDDLFCSSAAHSAGAVDRPSSRPPRRLRPGRLEVLKG